MAMLPYTSPRAGGLTEIAGVEPFQLRAGDDPWLTGDGVAGTAIDQFRLLGMVATTGALGYFDPAATNGLENLVGISLQPIRSGQRGGYLTGGCMNVAAIQVWPSGVTTLQQKKALFGGKPFRVDQVL
jgi:hypothetical protein